MGGTLVSYVGGRLGNNLFNIATGYYYANKTGRDFKIHVVNSHWKKYYDTYERFHLFENVNGPFIGYKVYCEDRKYNFKEIPMFSEDNVILDGSFESEGYFPDRKLIDNLFKCPDDMEKKIKEKYPDIENTVGISIRRGDYLAFRNLFLVPKTQWYLDCYEKYFPGKKVIVFSDDINYCKRFIGDRKDFTFYDNKHSFDQYMIQDPIENIYTMALCGNHICSCSTWSWWGARLCEKDGAINIFQDKKFTDSCGIRDDWYIPERWIKEKASYE